MTLVGYARVSTADQTLAPQTDVLSAAGCEKIFTDHGVSGALRERPGLTAALDYMRAGDLLVVAKLDRAGRSLKNLLALMTLLQERGVGFRSLAEAIDTTTASGRLLLHVLGAIAEFERNIMVERTHAGLAAARARGNVGGRPPALTEDQVAAATALVAAGRTVAQAAAAVGVGRSTLYRYLPVGSA